MSFLGGLVLLVLACIAIKIIVTNILLGIAWLFVHVVPWTLVFLVPGVVLFWYLHTERVQLTLKSATAVFLGCGVVSWSATTLLVTGNGLPSYYALPIAPGAFFTSTLLLLIVWAQCRQQAARARLAAAEQHVEAAERQAAYWQRQAQEFRAEARGIERQFGEAMAVRKAAADEVARLCALEPRTLGLLVAELTALANRMTSEQLATALAGHPEGDDRVGNRLRALILRGELSRRQSVAPSQRLEACLSEAAKAERRSEEERAAQAEVRAKAQHEREFYHALRSGPVVL